MLGCGWEASSLLCAWLSWATGMSEFCLQCHQLCVLPAKPKHLQTVRTNPTPHCEPGVGRRAHSPVSKVTVSSCFSGGEFTRQAEVTFVGHPGKLVIKQRFSGIDEHGHLTIDTELEGHVPQIPFGSSVHIEPYTELYHYSTSGEPQPCPLASPGLATSLVLLTHHSSRELGLSLGSGEGNTLGLTVIFPQL